MSQEKNNSEKKNDSCYIEKGRTMSIPTRRLVEIKPVESSTSSPKHQQDSNNGNSKKE
jgi:hypothetical protein